MDIGTKIKDARVVAKLTQEQVADALGVSRQTISNWENGKTYPDIVSVIKMSDLYSISLDHLLKEKEASTMANYLDYLEESTNTVKSKNKLSESIIISVYLAIWAFALIVYWFFTSGSDAMGYSLVFLWIILPVSTFVISFLTGKNNYFGKMKWMTPIICGIMHMLAEYATFSMANMITIDFTRINIPHFELIMFGAVFSIIGLIVGLGVDKIQKRRNK